MDMCICGILDYLDVSRQHVSIDGSVVYPYMGNGIKGCYNIKYKFILIGIFDIEEKDCYNNKKKRWSSCRYILCSIFSMDAGVLYSGFGNG